VSGTRLHDPRPRGAARIRPVAMRDTAGVLADVLIPLVAEGLLLRRQRVVGVLDRLDARRRAMRRLQLLRERYGEGPAVVALPRRRLAFVLSAPDARRMLEQTPEPFTAATREKRAALSRFEPHGVLVSTGSVRERRRRFNEQILETSRPVHHLGDRFAGVIDVEVAAMLDRARAAGSLEWDLFARTWWRVVRRIVLGDGARDDERVTDDLARLRADANWGPLAPRRPRRRRAFLEQLRRYVARAEPGSLAAEVAASGADGAVDAVQQIPQWLFAFDAAGMASYRTLALLDAHPAVTHEVRQEMASRADDTAGPGSLLRACVLESLRLWPTTPAILRDAITDTAWRDRILPAGTETVIFVPYFHRDERALAEADTFSPDLWFGDHPGAAAVMPFSLGPGQCPGRSLVLLTTGLLLARMLAAATFTQSHSRPLRAVAPLPATFSPFRLRYTVTGAVGAQAPAASGALHTPPRTRPSPG
jgi:cytochrome P450